jgi:N-acetylglucosamine kinase-like BadF-type ATPase
VDASVGPLGEGPFVLGLDAGGTKTVCYLADARGGLVAQHRTGGANLQAAGELALEKVLHAAMEGALGPHDVVPAAVCLGIAGVDREDDAAVVRGIMRRIGYKARVVVTNDALVALVAGAGHGPGVVIVAGTGSIAYGRNHAGQAARAGGWGYVLGDEGSGYWIGRLALRAVVRAADGRGPHTLLTQLILGHFGVARPEGLVHAVYFSHLPPNAIAAVARHVQAALDAGDTVAADILEQGACELVASARTVVSRLGLEGAVFPFVLAGGIFQAVPWLVHALEARLPTLAPAARVLRLEREPAFGAVLIALATLRGERVIPSYLPS